MLFDRSISFACLLTWLLWLVGAFLAIGDWLGFAPDDSGFAGLALIAGGHMLTVQRLVCRQGKREIEAFDLGRESVLRSVKQ